MKKILFSIIFSLFTLILFNSCSSSDDDGSSPIEHNDLKYKIIGTWKLTHFDEFDVNELTGMPNLNKTKMAVSSC